MKKKSLFLLSLALIAFSCSKDSMVTPGEDAPYKQGVTEKTIKFMNSSGTMQFVPDFTEMLIYITVEGTGNASHLGNFTVVNNAAQDMLTGEVLYWNGILTAANGDQLFTHMVEMWMEGDVEYAKYHVLSGNGRFKDVYDGEFILYGYSEMDPETMTGIWELKGEGPIYFE